MPPIGEFTITPDPATPRHRCAIAAGSGITPVLSLVSTTLETEPGSRWTVIYGNKWARSVMFLDELEGLKDRYRERLHLIHVLSREETVPLLSGRIDRARLEALFANLVDFRTVDEWFLCGPAPMVETARDFVESRGVDPALVHDELFFSDPRTGALIAEEDTTGSVTLTFTLEGRVSTVRMEREQTVLEAALAVRSELPFSCRGGMCATCKALVVEGEVRMDKNWALVDADLDQGYALTCQSHPVADRLVIDYDRR
jgi:ring-1,2-phenylacetyl-CoA epoxidase subunit PaaE